jgi:hypothetical protein
MKNQRIMSLNRTFLPRIIEAKASIQLKDLILHEKRTKQYKNLIRKSPRFADPLVILRDKTRRKIDYELSFSKASKANLWRGKSVSTMSNYENKLNQPDLSTLNSPHEKLNLMVSVDNNYILIVWEFEAYS